MKKVVMLVAAVCLTVLTFAQDAAEKINQANEAMKAKDYTKALELYESAMANLGDVQVPDAINFNIGLAAYNSKSYENAVEYFDKAIAADANAAKSYDYQARCYGKMKNYESAVACYEKAIAANEGDSRAQVYNAGISAYQGKLYEKAIGFFSTAVEGGYKGSTAQYYKAMVYKKMKNNDAYKTTLIEGVEKFAGDKKLGSSLAKVYVSEGNTLYKKGAGILSTANTKVNAGSLSTEDAAYTAEVDKAKKEFAAAVEVLEKAKAADASNANATKLLEACKAAL